MENISLYRKYRPYNFANLVGQEHVKTTLVNALKSDHVAQAYLFAGPRGTGKTSTARLIAKSLNCENLKDGFEPCTECELCKDIASGRLIDLIEIDAASNRGIDEMRDLKEKINFAPTRAKYKIYIIDEVHMLTKEAFNALLKTLEEPPDHAYFILATTEVHKIPDTIISRCQRFDFKRIESSALMKRLEFIAKEEGIDAESDALKMISKYADGGLRDAIGLLEQMNVDDKVVASHVQNILGMSSVSILENLYEHLVKNQTEDALKLVEELHSQGSDLGQFLHEFVDVLRVHMLEAVSAGKKSLVSCLLKMIEIFQDAQQKLDVSIPQLPLEIAVVRVSFLFDAAGKENRPSPVKAQVVENKSEATKEASPEVNVREHKSISQASKPEPKPEVKQEIKQEVKDEQSFESVKPMQSGDAQISLESVKDKWPRITERIKSPALRMSLKNGVPYKVTENVITLEFRTNFHRDKVMEHDNRAALEGIILETLGAQVKVEADVKELEIRPVVEPSVSFGEDDFGSSGEEVNEPKNQGGNIVNEALDIFGGEVVG